MIQPIQPTYRYSCDDAARHLLEEFGLARFKNLVGPVRHMLSNGIPKCCIHFNVSTGQTLVSCINYCVDNRLTESCATDPHFVMFTFSAAFFTYVTAISDALGKDKVMGYVPCPQCVIAGQVYDLPAACPCCKK